MKNADRHLALTSRDIDMADRDYKYLDTEEEMAEYGIGFAECCDICVYMEERRSGRITVNCKYHMVQVEPTFICKHFLNSDEI